MLRRWHEEMRKHGYDPSYPPTVGACHCARGIGFLRKRRPYDCGNPRCGLCHWSKFLHRKEGRDGRRIVAHELAQVGSDRTV